MGVVAFVRSSRERLESSNIFRRPFQRSHTPAAPVLLGSPDATASNRGQSLLSLTAAPSSQVSIDKPLFRESEESRFYGSDKLQESQLRRYNSTNSIAVSQSTRSKIPRSPSTTSVSNSEAAQISVFPPLGRPGCDAASCSSDLGQDQLFRLPSVSSDGSFVRAVGRENEDLAGSESSSLFSFEETELPDDPWPMFRDDFELKFQQWPKTPTTQGSRDMEVLGEADVTSVVLSKRTVITEVLSLKPKEDVQEQENSELLLNVVNFADVESDIVDKTGLWVTAQQHFSMKGYKPPTVSEVSEGSVVTPESLYDGSSWPSTPSLDASEEASPEETPVPATLSVPPKKPSSTRNSADGRVLSNERLRAHQERTADTRPGLQRRSAQYPLHLDACTSTSDLLLVRQDPSLHPSRRQPRPQPAPPAPIVHVKRVSDLTIHDAAVNPNVKAPAPASAAAVAVANGFSARYEDWPSELHALAAECWYDGLTVARVAAALVLEGWDVAAMLGAPAGDAAAVVFHFLVNTGLWRQSAGMGPAQMGRGRFARWRARAHPEVPMNTGGSRRQS